MQLAHRRAPGSARAVRHGRQRGAVMIEAAIVTPIFLLLVLGIMEIALAVNDDLALAHATRAGSRVASASGNDVYADYGILKAVAREGSAVPRDQVELIVVYRASQVGDAPNPQCQAGTSVAGVCNVYRPSDFARPKADFGCGEMSPDRYWCPNDRWVTLTSLRAPDYVGVWMRVRHPWVTHLFGSAVTLTDTSVIQLEPRGRA